MRTEVWQKRRPKYRDPIWAFWVMDGERTVFDSSWVSLRYETLVDVDGLASLILALEERKAYPGCPGHRPTGTDVDACWEGAVADNWGYSRDDLIAHAEHMSGPFRGGLWYCSVYRGQEVLFHTAHHRFTPRDGEAARWLCELVVRAVDVGVEPPADSVV